MESYLIDYEKAAASFKTHTDFFMWHSENRNSFALQRAKDYLRLLKIPDIEIEAICSEGMERIRNGKQPFDEGYPIDVDELRTTLRSWKKGKIHRYHKQIEEKALAELNVERQ